MIRIVDEEEKVTYVKKHHVSAITNDGIPYTDINGEPKYSTCLHILGNGMIYIALDVETVLDLIN